MKQHFYTIAFVLSSTTIWGQSIEPSVCPPSSKQGVHIVQPKETLYSISKKYKISIAQLCEWNHISEKDILPKCTSLIVESSAVSSSSSSVNIAPTPEKPTDIPQNYSYTPSQKPSSKSKYIKSTNKTHTIEAGETLESIAERYGYTSARLLSMNELESEESLFIGQVLKVNDCICETENTESSNEGLNSYSITSKSTIAKTENSYKWNPLYARVIHIVSHNNLDLKETPSSIGALYGLSGSDVMAMNGLKTDAVLPVGLRLTIEDRRQMLSPESNIKYVQPETPTSQPVPSSVKPVENTPSVPTTSQVSNNTSMTSEEMQMVDEINFIRSNPAGYIPYIEQYIQYLKENGDMGNSIATSQELIAELKRTPALPILQTLPCLYTAAKKHGDDQRKKGDTSHHGSDGSWPWDRVTRECPELKDGNENLVGGPSDIRRAVILLLVDDGIDTRGHRKTLLQADWKYVACHKMGTIGSMPNCWIQQFGN